MILCDLPYGTTKNKWDTVIPLDRLWAEYERLITDTGAIVLFAQTPFDKILGASKIELLKYEYIWDKKRPTGYLNANFAPMKRHEKNLVFSKGSACYVKNNSKAMSFYPKGLIEVNKKIKRGAQNGNYDNVHYCTESVQKMTNYPISILEYKTETGLHPTQKPVPLIEFLINTYTNESDLVLDNCAGSFTTAEACFNTNRKAICIEKELKYYEIGVERMKRAKEKQGLFMTPQ